MLTQIREKSQGAFAWAILLLICIPFVLWGIQNYLDDGKEQPVASVGDRDFYQREVTQAATQYSQNFAGMNISEEVIKAQALKKLINDEVLLQYVEDEGLAIADETARQYITNLPYFQVNGKFDDKQYKAMLSSQNMSSVQFTQRIKKAMIMEQFQRAIADSSFTTQHELDNFFKIQNQQRDLQFIKVPVPKLTAQPTADELNNYYQQHQTDYQTPEQISLEYVELSVDELAKSVKVTDEALQAHYQDQKDQYTTKERRKISHILFAINKETTAEQALQKAVKAQEDLKAKDFAVLAKEISDDKLSADKGGDLGLFSPGTMEADFDAAASSLALNTVSAPIKTSFGYHLVKVTELMPGATKPFAEVKEEVTKAYQKAQAETQFYELGEKMAQLSYESNGSLQAVADALKLTIQKTEMLAKDANSGIFAEAKVRAAAFSEEVINGGNSEPIEAGAGKLMVIRKLEHKPAATLALKDVEAKISAAVLQEKATQQALATANTIKQRLQAGENIDTVAAANQLQVEKFTGLTRNNDKLPVPITQAAFKLAKPSEGKPSISTVELAQGEQAVLSVTAVKPGVMSEEDKKQQALATRNIAQAIGQSAFAATLKSLEADADITIHKEK